MDDLIKEFIEETVESLSELDMDLVKLEQEPDNEELLANIFRLMHTIKGTCGFLGLPRLEKTAHAAENLLDLFRSGQMEITETAMTVLFLSIDRVRYLVVEVEENGSEPDGDDQDVISQIEAEIEAGTGGGGGKGDDASSDAESATAVADDPFAHIFDDDVVEESASDESKEEGEEEDSPESGNEAAVTTEAVPAPAPEPKKPAPTKKKKAAGEKSPEFLKVQMGVLEDLINMVSELVLTRNQILQLIEIDEDSAVSAPLQRLNRIASDLQEGVMKTRMQPIGNAWAKLPRIVRDLSMELNKKLSLEMSGEETELDRQVLEMIKDPLTHMVRNSCDHGVETPEGREAAGKPEVGVINLRAYHEGGFIIIEIEDDGKGLDAKVIGQKAVEKDLITADQLESLSDKQLLSNIFKPGFSMAKEVTSVSGRGVGMDVVRTNIEKIGGTIDMESTLGEGTKFSIQIPLTLAIISALVVEIDGLRYAIPQLNIQELVSTHSSSDKIEKIDDRPVFRLRDRIIPLIDSQTLFDGFVPNDDVADSVSDSDESEDQEMNIDDKLVVVITAGSSYFGLVVDAIHDMEEIVIKSASPVFHNTKIFSGNTILGDGDVIMILDPAGIARQFEVNNDMSNNDEYESGIGESINLRISEKASMLIFKAGAETPKAIPVALISRLQRFKSKDITDSGDQLVVNYNESLLPLYLAEEDMEMPKGDEVTSLILSDDVSDSAMGIVIEEVIDIVEDHLDLTSSTARTGVIGSVRLNGETVDVVDIAYYLGKTQEDFFSTQAHAQTPFAEVAEANGGNATQQASDGKIRVLVVDDSPFFRNMLKPILTSAGFNVTTSEDPIEAIKLHDGGHMFDIILSDIEMPNMTGYQFVEKMKTEDTKWKDLPFIAITSHTTAQDVEYGYSKGFTKYIGKFDKEELMKAVNAVLSSSS